MAAPRFLGPKQGCGWLREHAGACSRFARTPSCVKGFRMAVRFARARGPNPAGDDCRRQRRQKSSTGLGSAGASEGRAVGGFSGPLMAADGRLDPLPFSGMRGSAVSRAPTGVFRTAASHGFSGPMMAADGCGRARKSVLAAAHASPPEGGPWGATRFLGPWAGLRRGRLPALIAGKSLRRGPALSGFRMAEPYAVSRA